MTPVGTNNTSQLFSKPANGVQPAAKPAENASEAVKTEKSGMVLTDEGKALLAALQEMDKEGKDIEKERSAIKSFAHGAMGMDHPEAIEEKDDSGYSAGQYLKGAATAGLMLLAIV